MSNTIGPKGIGRLAAAIVAAAPLALAFTAGHAAPPQEPRAVFTVTNASTRVVECTVVMDGDTWTNIKVPVGDSYTEDFRANRRLQLVCMRGFDEVYGPLKLGVHYRFVDKGSRKIAVVSGEGEAPVGPS